MRNLLAFLAVVALTVVAAGWYLDWFQIHRAPSGDGQPHFSVDINTDKISQDFQSAEAKIQKKLTEKSKAGDAPASSVVRSGTSRQATTPAQSPIDLPEVDVPTVQIDR
jgi:hypothetical protein